MNEIVYSYVGGDPLEDRHSYTYTTYQGSAFLEAWRASRESFLTENTAPDVLTAKGCSAPSGKVVNTQQLLCYLLEGLQASAPSTDIRHWRDWIIKRFEVSKRLHGAYRLGERSLKGNGEYRDAELYLTFAECMALSYRLHDHLPSLNALHKCVDSLCSLAGSFESQARARLSSLILAEINFVVHLSRRHHPADPVPETAATNSCGNADLSNVILVLADTLRSRGYAQAIAHSGFQIGAVVIVEAIDGAARWGQSNAPPAPDTSLGGRYFVPDLRVPLEQTCRALTKDVQTFQTGTVNDISVSEAVAALGAELVVFSGFGGEIVKADFLEAAKTVLHMHAGWLPDYRGSTTIYYSMLRKGSCDVSAILLNSEIDEGEIVRRKTYPIAPAGMDIDYLYDSIIRSDTMLEVLSDLAAKNTVPETMAQSAQEGDTYYIIHPILKHLAIMKTELAAPKSN